jgi:hypothetical protein
MIRKTPLVLSYLSGGRWHFARVLVTEIEDEIFEVKVTPRKRRGAGLIEAGQAVGMQFKYGRGSGYDKYVFDTSIARVESNERSCGVDKIFLWMPQQIDLVPRRSFFRVKVPSGAIVNVEFRQRYCTSDDGHVTIAAGPRWEGTLVDLSAGGMQIAVKRHEELRLFKGDSVSLKFTPMDFETPLMCNAHVRSVLPTADGRSNCYGLQLVGLEASPEGRLILARLVSIVEQYHQMNH